MQKYQNNVVSSNGTPVAFAYVTVSNYPSGTLATVYSDNGVTLSANPLAADGLGNFSFYAADGRYSLSISGSGIATQTVADILLEDPADANSYVITGGSINNAPIGATTPRTGAFTTLSASGVTSVNLNSGTAPTPPAGTTLQISQADGVQNYISAYAFGGVTNRFVGYRANGTNAAKTAITTSNALAFFGGGGYGATSYSAGPTGYMNVRATEAWTDTAQGTELAFVTTAAGTASQAITAVISSTGLAVTGTSSATNGIIVAPVAFASLPASPVAGQRAMINNSTAAPAFLSVAAGGGSTTVPVFYNGTQWLVG